MAMLSFSRFIDKFIHHHHEVARKITHISFGLGFIAVRYIFGAIVTAVLGLFFAVALLVIHSRVVKSTLYKYVRMLYEVGRTSWGEVFYALGVAAASVLTYSAHEFAIVISITALADSAASLVGKAVPSPSFSRNFATASIAGSTAFFIVSAVVIVMTQTILTDIIISPSLLIVTSLILTAVEAFSPYGADNLLVPVIASILLFT